jgi:diguanylate cyclase (GGDEF)-like protein
MLSAIPSDSLYYMQVNLFAVCVLLIMLWTFHKRGADRFLSDQRLFVWMLSVNTVLLLLDSGACLLNGNITFPALVANRIFTCGFFALQPMMVYLYLLYCNVKCNVPWPVLRRRALAAGIPAALYFLLAVLSLFEPLLYELDAANRYHRGPLYPLLYLYSAAMILAAFWQVRRSAQKSNASQQRVYRSVLLFPILPALGCVLQICSVNFSVIWTSTVLSLMLLFINIQNAQITTDVLTGLYNRSQLAAYLTRKTDRIRAGLHLYLIMLDLDRFKSINDTYGHLVGDDALIRAADILRAAAGPADFLVRYGGDEFLIIAERANEEEVSALLAKIHALAESSNASGAYPYKLIFSGGWSCWPAEGGSIDLFISEADRLMYRKKAEKQRLDGEVSAI